MTNLAALGPLVVPLDEGGQCASQMLLFMAFGIWLMDLEEFGRMAVACIGIASCILIPRMAGIEIEVG